MPIYEYRCNACGHELEKLQRMSDQPLTDCPDCGAAEMQRLVSAAGFRLKGGGWYETDFKKDGKRNLHDSTASAQASASTEASGKKDSAGSDKAASKESRKPSSQPTASPSAA